MRRRGGVDLPVEIWLYIAEFLSPNERRKLLGTNRLFFEIIMDELYRKLSLVSPSPRLFVETMQNLLQPNISRRVRSLTVWPSALCMAIYPIEPDEPEDPYRVPSPPCLVPPAPTRSRSLSRTIGHLFGRRKEVPIVHPSPFQSKRRPPLPTSVERFELFKRAILNLTHVEDVTIRFRPEQRQGYDKRAPVSEFLRVCLAHWIWPAIKGTVRSITLDVYNLNIATFLPSAAFFTIPENLEHLAIKLRSESAPEPVSFALVAFIHELSRTKTLQTLSVETSCWYMWDYLGTLSSLKRLEFHVPVGCSLDPRAKEELHEFLFRNPTIQHLALTLPEPASPHPLARRAAASEVHVDYEFMLPNLASLELALHKSPAASDRVLESVGLLSRNITQLHFTNQILLLRHFRLVLDALSPVGTQSRLQELTLSVQSLSPEFVDLLARRCPNLLKLRLEVELIVDEAVDYIFETRPYRGDASDEVNFIKNLQTRSRDPACSRYYTQWALYDISILRWVYKEGRRYDWDVMKAIADVVPAIRSFAGRGHLHRDGLTELEPKPAFMDLGRRSPAWS